MRHEQFTHAIQAAADIVKDEIVVVGSQAVLGQFAEAPDSQRHREATRKRLAGLITRAT